MFISKKVASDIKALKIQGAENIAKAAFEALIADTLGFEASGRQELREKMNECIESLEASRPTEPEMHRVLSRALKCTAKHTAVEDIKDDLRELKDEINKEFSTNNKKIAEFGSTAISNGMTVLTHCHSTTALGIIKQAKKDGKDFKVVCTESRPRCQGRMTAEELAKAGIKTTMIVEGAVASKMKDIDVVIIGADAVAENGDVVNKIGSQMVATLARDNKKPVYVAASTWKIWEGAKNWQGIPIESREPSEVWENAPANVAIENPAFDYVDNRMITRIVTEKGFYPPRRIRELI